MIVKLVSQIGMQVYMPNRYSSSHSLRIKVWFLYPLFYGVIAMGPAKAQDAAPLTLEQTFRSVYKTNPTLQAARHDLDVVREEYPQAAAGWKPRVTGEASLTSTDIESGNFSAGDGATTKSASISIEQPIFRGFRTVSEMKAAEESFLAAEKNLQEREQSVFFDVAEAYVSVLKSRALIALQEKNRDLLGQERDAVQARFDAGDLTQTDVQQTEARYADALARLAAAQSAFGENMAVFEELTGFFPPDTMTMPEPSFNFPQSEEALVLAAAQANPTMAAMRHEHLAAQSDIGAVRSDLYPQVTAFASHIKEYDPQPGIVDESEMSTVGMRARISLYEGGANLSRVRQAKARANQRYVQIVETEMAVKRATLASWRKYGAYGLEIAAREREADAARFSAEGVREEARLGDRSVFDVLEAEREVLDAETALIEAKAGKVITAYNLSGALGLLTAGPLGLLEEEVVPVSLAVQVPVPVDETAIIAENPPDEAQSVTVYPLDAVNPVQSIQNP